MNRRDLLKSAAAGVALSAFAPHVAGADARPLRVGVIGCGWYGKNDVYRLIQVSPVEVVSLCDVDKRMLEDAANHVSARQASKKRPRLFGDYRKMLKERDLEIVIVGTPDHWHALPMIAACEAGADVYVQKPISTDVREGEAMVAAARKHNRVVQVGMQRRSTPHLIDAINQVIKAGLLGTVGHVDICCYFHMRARENSPDIAPPEHLDYEMWTGPAPMRPFNRLIHPRGWRGFMEYGNGIVGDMCVHMLDTARWMLDLGWPSRISSSGGIYVHKSSKANITDTQTATFEFDQPKLTVTWTHRMWGTSPDREYPWAVFIHGEKGVLKASTERWGFYPNGQQQPSQSGRSLIEPDKYPEEKGEKDFEAHAATANRAHMRSFLEAREKRGKPSADIEQGHISAASCILANIAMEQGKTINVDPASGKVVGDAAVERLLGRPYRGEWKHPGGAGEWTPWAAAGK